MTAVLTPVERARPATWQKVVPIGLAVATVLIQIAYPLVQGATRDAATVLTVLLFSAASLSHAWTEHGWVTGLKVLVVLAGGGLAVEVVGVATGFPFGTYTYSDRIGPVVAGVPLVIPLAWAMMGYPALVVARLITGRRWVGTTVAAGALATWDLFLDPQMVAEGYWTWDSAGPHLIGTVPATNYLAWFATSWLMAATLWHVTRDWSRDRCDLRVPVGLYAWTWGGSALAHLAFFGLPRSGLYGGLGMGLFVALLLRSQAAGQAISRSPVRRRARP